jgi:serine/threonine-protein phosphatase 6 regulatory ankyrin repeat subunit B
VLARLLLEHDADTAAKTEDKWTPLHVVSQGGHVEIAQLLLQHGANAAAQDEYGETPLHLACDEGHMELALLLVQHGASAEAQDDGGLTPVLSSEGGHVLAQLLISKWTPLHWASKRGHMELARLFVNPAANLAAKTTDGWTPLHLASENGHLEVVQLLLERGSSALPISI